ncbi:HlyC/CorC family transporter [Chlorobaculum sp. 24CR]|uniref:hemolysin family protein n=1 Tax=Chlorobaculum sp. 24CR TaxID=2508878 RepID=UPI00100A36EA|nr:hemolysin family protein [Chlorobaculum sp. 24CR]RXK82327.1 HlyC/CorC family transporter [Chlorobaculum sp. 24CR]
MNSHSAEALFILFLILIEGVLSLGEFAIISSSPSRLRELREAGYASASVALKLQDNAARFLSSVKVTATLVATLTGVLGGLFFSEPLAALFGRIGLPEAWRLPLALALVIASLAYVSHVVGRLLPKKFALRHPESIAVKMAGIMDKLCAISSPAVLLAEASAALVLRAFGVEAGEKPQVSDEDVMLMIRQGAKKGVFESVEYEMISRIFRMSDKRASAIMTPRSEIEWLDLDRPDEELVARIRASGRSRFPVAKGGLDELQGVVRSLDLVNFSLTSKRSIREAIRASMQPPLFVPESVPAFHVLELFRKNRAHLALVIDEHGSVQGTITLTDVLESIVGDVPADDVEGKEKRIVRRSERTWLVDGMLPVDEFLVAFNLEADKFFEEDEPRSDTMGGFIMTRLGEVPSVSDAVRWNGLVFKVIKMNGKRVGRILVEQEAKSGGKK